jgi:hypothetical protein
MPDRAFLRPDIELIEVVSMRKKTVHLDVDGMRQLSRRHRHAARDDLLKPAVGGHAPANRNRLLAQAGGIGGIGSQPGPEYDSLRRRIARSDPKRERIRTKLRRTEKIRAAQQSKRQACLNASPRMFQKPSSIGRGWLSLGLFHQAP